MYAYLFPGQGSQEVGMGQSLYETSPASRAIYDQADQMLDISITDLCFNGPADVLNDTANTQPAIFTTSIAALRALQALDFPTPTYVAGHSLGEFSALVAADVLSFEDGLNVVRERGRLMKQAGDQNPGGMGAIIALSREDAENVCATIREQTGEYVGIANDNCPGQIVISGSTTALDQALALASENGARKTVKLAVSIACHSPLMTEATTQFSQLLNKTTFNTPTVPVIANATATPLTDPDAIRDAIRQQLTSPVNWTDSMQWVIEQGVTHFVEIGPKEVLTGLMKRIDRSKKRLTLEDALAQQQSEA